MVDLTIVSEEETRQHLTREIALMAVRRALISISEPGSTLFPVALGKGIPDKSMVAIKSGMSGQTGVVGVKVGTYWPGNDAYGVPRHGSTTLLLNPDTGLPTALVNGVALNGLRTAAANAAATDKLARADASTLAVIGAGKQALCEVDALIDIRPIEKVFVWSRNIDNSSAMAEVLGDRHKIEFTAVPRAQEAVEKADIITTVTTATQPLVFRDWVRPGTHISAMGADNNGKQELDTKLVGVARVFADYPEQSARIGELQHAVAEGIIRKEDISAIGKVLSESIPGRRSNDEITLFDSSGIALQDIAVASALIEQLEKLGIARKVNF